MADGGEEAAASRVSSPEHLDEYNHLIELGLDARVAGKLEAIYRTGKLIHSELDDRALDALKEFPADGAQAVLQQFLESNLEHVSNKSAFLCGIMKTYRQKLRALGSAAAVSTASSGGGPAETSSSSFDLKPVGKGPDEEKIKAILERTGYTLDVTTGQRKYGGPPPNWTDPPPPNGCEVFCGKIPRDVYEDELIPLFEKCGTIWDLRLMMDPLTNLNRGYAFVTFTTTDAAQEAVDQLDDMEMKGGRHLKVNISVPNLRLFVGNIPKSKGKSEIYEEFSKVTAGLAEVIIYSSPDDRRKNRGFCFLEYDSHKSASLAKRRLSTGRVKIFGCDIIVDWADPQEEPDNDTMSKVKVLYVRNLTQECTEERLKEAFEAHGPIQRVKKIKDYAFVHFETREDTLRAMEALNGRPLHGSTLDVSLAKPPSDRKKKEEILKARERRLLQQNFVTRGMPTTVLGPGGGGPLVAAMPPVPAFRGGVHHHHHQRPTNLRGVGGAVPSQASASGPISFGRDFDYEYSFGPYRGGYPDPYYNGGYYPYAGNDYYYDFPARSGGGGRGGRPTPGQISSRGGRGRGRGGRGGVSESIVSSPAMGGTTQRWRGSEGSPIFASRGPSRGGWRGGGGGRGVGPSLAGGRSGHPRAAAPTSSSGAPPKNPSWSEESGGLTSEESVRGRDAGTSSGDSVGMGTWRPDAQQGGSSGGGNGSGGGGGGASSGAPEDASVWYQDTYGTQWS